MKVLGHRFRNLFNTRLTKDWKQNLQAALNLGTCQSELSFKVFRANGTVEDLGVVGRRVVTTAGVNYLAAVFTGTGAVANIKFHDSGTGATAAAIGDTAMQTPYGGARDGSGAQSNPSANIYRSIGTLSYTGTLAITEWGIFTASTVGTLFDRFTFAAINVVNGDSIQATFNLTFTAGS